MTRNTRNKVHGVPCWQRGDYGWYADFRKYDGGRVKVGETEEEAHAEIARRVEDYREVLARRDSLDGGNPTLVDLARDHLRKKKGTVKEKTIKGAERSIRHLIAFLGTDARASDVTPRALSDFIQWRLKQSGYKGEKIKPSTVNVDLAHISSMCTRAVAYGVMDTNPVSKVPDKPRVRQTEPEWLERGEAWRVMEEARKHQSDPNSRCYPYLHELVSTMLLTGGRSKEVRGLLVSDVLLEDDVVIFRPNEIRDLKRGEKHKRRVPLWPQLREILEPHIEEVESGPLFPATNASGKRIVGKISESLDSVLEAAEVEKRVTPHTFRHTYTAHRMQTLDGNAPVSPYTVMRELGHANLQQIIDRYGHLLESRHRSPVVSYGEATVTDIREAK